MSRVFAIHPVAHVEVVLEVTHSTALFLAKAAVPLALGHLPGNRHALSLFFDLGIPMAL